MSSNGVNMCVLMVVMSSYEVYILRVVMSSYEVYVLIRVA